MIDYGKYVGDGGYPDLLNAAAERERALQEEVERLRGKCNRLRDYIAEIWANEEGRPDTPEGRRDMELNIRLHPDDMTPEPPGAASEVEGE